MKKIVTIYYDAGSKHEEKLTCTVDEQCMLRTMCREGFRLDDERTKEAAGGRHYGEEGFDFGENLSTGPDKKPGTTGRKMIYQE